MPRPADICPIFPDLHHEHSGVSVANESDLFVVVHVEAAVVHGDAANEKRDRGVLGDEAEDTEDPFVILVARAERCERYPGLGVRGSSLHAPRGVIVSYDGLGWLHTLAVLHRHRGGRQ